MFSGAVYMNLHKLDLNDVRGFGRKKPLLMFIFLMGYLSIIGMPFFSGYVSKTLLHESIVEKIWLFENYSAQSSFFRFAEAVFTLSGGFTAAYMTKLFVCIFIEKNNTKQKEYDDLKGKYMNSLSAFALVGSAVILWEPLSCWSGTTDCVTFWKATSGWTPAFRPSCCWPFFIPPHPCTTAASLSTSTASIPPAASCRSPRI